MTAKTLDAGDKLMFSGDARQEVEALLADHLQRGCRVISGLSQVGQKWVAACTLPPTDNPDDTSSFALQDFVPPPKNFEPEHDDGCTITPMGAHRLITGPSKRAVQIRINHLTRFGASMVSDIEEQSGQWVAILDVGGADKHFIW